MPPVGRLLAFAMDYEFLGGFGAASVCLLPLRAVIKYDFFVEGQLLDKAIHFSYMC